MSEKDKQKNYFFMKKANEKGYRNPRKATL